MVAMTYEARFIENAVPFKGKTQAVTQVPPCKTTTGLSDKAIALVKATITKQPIVLDGYRLTNADVVNAARFLVRAEISSDAAVLERIEASIRFLHSRLNQSIYGVTTGFGGSADTRTLDHVALQRALLEHQLVGVIPSTITPGGENMMPEAIVRGAMLIRVNSLVRGHSAVRKEILDSMIYFLNHNIAPVVPLRGSISASGDLSPLSYIASAVCGHPDIKVIDRSSGKAEILTADECLGIHGLKPIQLGPKEGLGLINGTAFSASAAALAMYDANFYAGLTQVLTGMTVEAVNGMKGSFHPFIHDATRPHPGQIEAAANIRGMLAASKLAVSEGQEVDVEADAGVLRQDRYPLRCSPQWLGPQLESLALANSQVGIELNSTTDNPLMDVNNEVIHHGGAFMAFSITQAMEATRLTLEHFGKLAFAQLTELINCSMNRGLPSCLAGSAPSTNYFAKGIDIHAAAYTTELGFLASPMSTHIQSSEQHNQSINSMALASARKTIEANNVLGMLLASHLLAVCQAIDLRVIDIRTRASLKRHVAALTAEMFPMLDGPAIAACWAAIERAMDLTTSLDPPARWQNVVEASIGSLVPSLNTCGADASIGDIGRWRDELIARALQLSMRCHDEVVSGRVDAAELLGKSAGAYRLVRDILGVRFRVGDVATGLWGSTIGSSISIIFEALQTPNHRLVILSCLA